MKQERPQRAGCHQPPSPLARPHNAPLCRAFSQAPGFGARMGGIVVRYLKQSRGNKVGLCAPRKPRAGSPRPRTVLPGAHAHGGQDRARVTQSFPTPWLTPSPLASQSDGKRGRISSAGCYMFNRINGHFLCFYRKHRSLK